MQPAAHWRVRNLACWVPILLVAAAAAGCATSSAGPAGASTANQREDIYVLRSVREERNPKSSWCTLERAGFAPFNSQFLIEDRYTMWAVAVQAQDGRIADAKSNLAGELHACFGATADPKVINFYTEGQIAGVPLIGSGDCLVVRGDYPEKGIATIRCYLSLRGLPSPYVSGFLTSNTLFSRSLLGGETDPPGYVQASIATIRLWRAR